MCRFLILILFHFVVIHAFGQQQKLDSILQKLSAHQGYDSTRFDLYHDIADAYSQISPDLGVLYADSAISLAGRLGLESREAEGLNTLGSIYWSLGKDSLALDAYRKSLDYYLKQGNHRKVGIAYNNIGLIHYNMNDYIQALEYHEMANDIFKELGINNFLTNSLSNTGVVFLALADYPKALEFFLEASKYVTEEKSVANANIQTNIGLVYKNLQNYPASEKAHSQAIGIYRDLDHKYGLAGSLSNLANIFESQRKTEQALDLYQEALKINQEIGNPRRIASDYSNLGILYKGTGKFGKALEYFESSDSLYTQLGEKTNLSLVLIEKAETLKLQAIENNSPLPYRRIIGLIKKSVDLAEQSGSLLRLNVAWLALSEILEEIGDIKGSFEAYKKHVVFKDSIFNEDNKLKIMQQQVQFEYDKKEAYLTAGYEIEKEALASRTYRAQLTRNFLVIAILVLLSIGVIIWNLYQKRIKAENSKKDAVFRAKVSDMELKALRAQMNPHFIFNSLNSISNYMLKNNPEKADHYLQKFSKLIRMILECSDQKSILLSEELEILELYVQLERLRLDKNLDFEVQVDSQLDSDNTLIPPLLLQPFIENSIWHGISKTSTDGRIFLKVFRDSDKIRCSISDNGVGRQISPLNQNPNGKHEHKSMGLKITQERLKILNSSLVSFGEIIWKDLPQGLEVQIDLPFNCKF